jgi:S1-C subfamily serine protease
VRVNRRSGLGLLILSVDQESPAERASLLIGDLLIGTQEATFTTSADLIDAITEADSGRLKLRFLRGDNPREREVVICLGDRLTQEAA